MKKDRTAQSAMFDDIEPWREHWHGMPEYNNEDLAPWQTIKFHFRNREDRQELQEKLGCKFTDKTQYMWYPHEEIIRRTEAIKYKKVEQGRYPIYIISKGRWERRPTSRALENLGIDYKIVIEPQEFDQYAAVISEDKIFTLPFSNLGQGSIPARNWVMEHSISLGAERHWILDDNLDGFTRLNNNEKTPVCSENPFIHVETFVNRYENVAMAGLNYHFLCKRKFWLPPYYLNTRVYSCILLKNDTPHRWRGRYNEDTDLSLRLLKDGNCTFLSNTYLANKQATMTMKGGNTEDLYQDDGRLLMAQSLVDQHPDVVKVSHKWGRDQHHVDYSSFRKNKLIFKESYLAAIENKSSSHKSEKNNPQESM
ncbi:MAG: hypothetical protein V3V84_02480 [Candidatus Bathyarchaeia archaeon]